MTDSYKIGSTDLTSVLDHLLSVQGAVAPPTPLQSDYLVPGKNAAVAAPVWSGPRVLTVEGIIVGTGATASARRDSAMNKLKTFSDLVYSGGSTYTVTRTIGTVAGTATGRYVGGLEQVGYEAGHIIRVSADISLLTGQFYVNGTAQL